MDADIQAKALFWLTIFAFVFARYGPQRIFVSIHNPSTLIAGSGQQPICKVDILLIQALTIVSTPYIDVTFRSWLGTFY